MRHGHFQAVRGVSLTVEAGETRGARRGQRRGEVDAAPRVAGAPQPRAGEVRVRRRRRHAHARARARAARDRARARGPALFPSLTVEENLLGGAGAPGPWTSQPSSRRSRCSAARRPPARASALGRRAAGAGDRPRAHEQPTAAARRRGLARARAGRDRRVYEARRAIVARGHDGRARRAGPKARAAARSASCACSRAASSWRARRAS